MPGIYPVTALPGQASNFQEFTDSEKNVHSSFVQRLNTVENSSESLDENVHVRRFPEPGLFGKITDYLFGARCVPCRSDVEMQYVASNDQDCAQEPQTLYQFEKSQPAPSTKSILGSLLVGGACFTALGFGAGWSLKGNNTTDCTSNALLPGSETNSQLFSEPAAPGYNAPLRHNSADLAYSAQIKSPPPVHPNRSDSSSRKEVTTLSEWILPPTIKPLPSSIDAPKKINQRFQYIIESKRNARSIIDAAIATLHLASRSQHFLSGDVIDSSKAARVNSMKPFLRVLGIDEAHLNHLFVVLNEMSGLLREPCDDARNNCLNVIIGKESDSVVVDAKKRPPSISPRGDVEPEITISGKDFELCAVDASQMIIKKLAQSLLGKIDLYELNPKENCDPYTTKENEDDINADLNKYTNSVISRKRNIGTLIGENWSNASTMLADLLPEVPGYATESSAQEQIAAFTAHYQHSAEFRKKVDEHNADYWANTIMALGDNQIKYERKEPRLASERPLTIISGTNK